VKGRERDAVEGFRVLTLRYDISELPSEQRARLEELFEKFRAIASMYFWSKRLGLREGTELALKRARELIPYYWRRVFDDESPLYAFSDVEKMTRPRKHVLRLPLTEALQVIQQNEKPKTGAHINYKESKLVIYLGDGERLELPVPRRALHWLRDKEREVAPLTVRKTARIQWRPERAQALKVQIILRLQRPRPPRPDPKSALLVYVDVNSNYGIAAIFASYDEGYAKIHETLKLRPPNRGRRLREAAKRKQAAARGSKPNVNRAIARLTEEFDSEGWKKKAIAEIFKRALKYAKGKSVLMNFDVPDFEKLRNSYLQKTLSVRKIAENLAKWYGIYIEFRCFPSRRCPLCGGRLAEFRTKRVRVTRCSCGFTEDRDYTPFYWWVRELGLPLPKWPLRRLRGLPTKAEPNDPEARTG